LRAYGRIFPIIVLLGILSSAAEAVGIGLFLPLLEPTYLVAGPVASQRSVIARTLAAVESTFSGMGRTGIIVGFILTALTLKAILSYTNGWLSARKNLQIGHTLRSRLFDQLLNSGYAFVSQSEWGKLLETLSTQTWRTTEALSAAISLIVNACTVLVFVILLLFLSWKLTLAIAICMLLLSTALRWIRQPVAKYGEKAVELNGRLGELMVDGILGVRTIEAYNLEEFMHSQFAKASDRVRAAFLRVETWSGLVNPCAEVSSSLLLLGLIVLSIHLGAQWPIVIVTVMMIYRLQMPFKQLETARVNWSALHGAAVEVFDLLERTAPANPTLVHGQNPVCFERLKSAIKLDNVSFSYPGSEKPSLSKVTAEIPRGKVTALVGLSGAGKTTLLNLLCGLQQPSAGEILVNGHSLRHFDPRSWRSRLALAGQDVHLFNTTVRENIRYGRLDATDTEIVEAARKANVDEFIEHLPRGYDTQVGDNGGRISGGQRQRIALARAFLRNPELLVLDEATNALDSISEQWVQSVLENFQDRCTVLVAAHRFSTIQNADYVIVLEAGRVIELGSPSSLRMQNGLFARLYELQSLVFASET
jgi:subfamily B ATP-binding cassette protein MsbA